MQDDPALDVFVGYTVAGAVPGGAATAAYALPLRLNVVVAITAAVAIVRLIVVGSYARTS